MKSLAFIQRNDTRFAVGDFSPVLSVFSHHDLGSTITPFLLLDHIGPGRLLPSTRRQGINDHPHRGFETVTIVYEGEIEHRDSTGNGGTIGPGDVQWMTAAAGIIHREMFSEDFTQRGGRFEMVQLWVNLPAADKMSHPGYQSLTRAEIPVLELPGEAGTVRIIAGGFNGTTGPARTHTRMNVLDARIRQGHTVTFPTTEGDTALVYLLSGRVHFDTDEALEEQGMAVLSQQGADIPVTALEDSRMLVLTGARIDEPINGHGPFVMNSYEEILQAYDDVKNGRLCPPA